MFLGHNQPGTFSLWVTIIDTRLQTVIEHRLAELEDDEECWEEVTMPEAREFLDLLESERPGAVAEELKEQVVPPPPPEPDPVDAERQIEERIAPPPEPRRRRSQW